MRSRRIDVYFYIYVSQNIHLSNTKYVCEFIESKSNVNGYPNVHTMKPRSYLVKLALQFKEAS